MPGTPEIGRLLDGFVTQANCPGRIALSGRRSGRKRASRRGPWLVAGPRATGPGLPSTKFGRNSMGSRQETVSKGFAPVRTLAGAELAHIAATLRETKWLVGGQAWSCCTARVTKDKPLGKDSAARNFQRNIGTVASTVVSRGECAFVSSAWNPAGSSCLRPAAYRYRQKRLWCRSTRNKSIGRAVRVTPCKRRMR